MMHLKHISISISATATKTAWMGITQAVSLEMTKAVEKGVSWLLLMLGGASVNAQNQKKMATVGAKDTIPFFRGMAVGVDVIGPVQLMVSDYGQYEASLRINLKDKYYPVFELGYGKADASDESTQDQLQDQRSLCPHRCRLEPAEEQARRLPSVRWLPLWLHILQIRCHLLHRIQDPVWGGEVPYGAEGMNQQLSLAGRSLRSRCQDLGSRPYGMEFPIQTPAGREGWRNRQQLLCARLRKARWFPTRRHL